MNRRDILKLSIATPGLSFLAIPPEAHTKRMSHQKKLIWILLRGGMDGLHATIPVFEPRLMKLRKNLVQPIQDQLLPLNRGFALHPALKFMHKLFLDKQLNAIVATATPHRQRSHFAAQDLLESGLPKTDIDNGWLARALNELNTKGTNNQTTQQSIAIAQSLPIAMRGGSNSMTWYPSALPVTSDDLHQRLFELYKHEQSLSERLKQALKTQDLVEGMRITKRHKKFSNLAKSCASLISEPNGPTIAMLESSGWDTHSHQVNKLNTKFKDLNDGIKALNKGLKDQWADTIFIISTEFGRTIKVNGTGGTDHGTATTMFIGGGAIEGGNVLGDWPGLGKQRLFQGRDLKPTSNSFDWIASSIKSHWQLSNEQIDRILPKS